MAARGLRRWITTQDNNRDDAKGTDMEVGGTAHSTERECGERGRNKERVMGSPKDRRTSAHSEDNNDTWVAPTEGKRGSDGAG